MLESTSNATNQTTSYIVTLEQDPEDPEGLLMPIPDDLFDQLGWEEGDELLWEVTEQNTIILRKVTPNDLQSNPESSL